VAPVAVRALAEALGVAVRGQDATVTGVTLDSRAIREGDLYAAIPGSVTHGAQYVEQARQAGARAILTDPAGADRAARTCRS
jgi:UDP-N-acetylmuramoyl-L-alanyl-D-glutamate--2,6-diaminopimelate ligase